MEQGVQHAQEIGFGEIIQRGARAVDALASELVYVDLSLGVLPAQYLAQTRPGARGAIFLHACLPRSEFGSAWPKALPAQIHAMDADPFFVGDGEIEAAKALAGESAEVRLFLYPGDEHLFSDRLLAAYDPAALFFNGDCSTFSRIDNYSLVSRGGQIASSNRRSRH